MKNFLPASKLKNSDPDFKSSASAEGIRTSANRVSEAQPLGNTTKFADESGTKDLAFLDENQEVRRVFDPKKGEIFSFSKSKSGEFKKKYSKDGALLERWMLHKQAQRTLSRPELWEEREKQTLVPYTDLAKTVEICLLSENKDKKGVISRVKPLDLRVSELDIKIQPPVRNKKYYIKGSLNKAPIHRVVMCHRNVVPGQQAEIWQNPENDGCSFHNLAVCGSVWTCPLCSLKINLERREEIKQAYEAIRQANGAAYMLTFTIKHGIGDNISDLLDRYKKAMRLLQKTQEFKEVTRSKALKRPQAGSLGFLDYLGRISTLEVTHSARNGWHPHEHHLWFFKRELTNKEITAVRNRLFDAWKKSCLEVGLPAPKKTIKVGKTIKHLGVDMRRALNAEEYLTKYGQFDADGNPRERRWGPENELAGSHVKTANLKGSTPFQLLADAVKGDVYSRERFVEFANAFKGRHQLHFSEKLNEFLKESEVDVEKTDDEIAQKKDGDSVFLHEFKEKEFEKIVHNRAHDHVLIIAKNKGLKAAREYIASLPSAAETVQTMTTFKQFCEHYELDLDSDQAKKDYKEYIDNLYVLKKLDRKKEAPDKKTKQ